MSAILFHVELFGMEEDFSEDWRSVSVEQE